MSETKIFTLEEAKQLLPWLREVTSEAHIHLLGLQKQKSSDQEKREKSRTIIIHWAETVAKLGACPKQPFTVDFDSGEDYFCWEYPEKDILYRHDYHLGYKGRRPIQ